MRLSNALAADPRRLLMVGAVSATHLSMTLLLSLEPTAKVSLALLGTWLLFAAVIRYRILRADLSQTLAPRIPVRFSGDLGGFSVQPRGDGRLVEVRAGSTVVAKLTATDAGDHLVVDPAVARREDVDALGIALGRAIEMVVAADEHRSVVQRIANVARWDRTARMKGTLLRRVTRRGATPAR